MYLYVNIHVDTFHVQTHPQASTHTNTHTHTHIYIYISTGLDSVIGIATLCVLDCPRIKFWWNFFSTPAHPVLGHTQPRIRWIPGHPGMWGRPAFPSIAEVKESVELYLYSSSGPCFLSYVHLTFYLIYINFDYLYLWKHHSPAEGTVERLVSTVERRTHTHTHTHSGIYIPILMMNVVSTQTTALTP